MYSQYNPWDAPEYDDDWLDRDDDAYHQRQDRALEEGNDNDEE